MSVNEKMTAIANEVRTISDSDEAIGLDKMAEYLNGANAEVNSQTDLIAQIQSALEGKVVGSSEPILQNKTIAPTTTEQTITADDGYDGLSTVIVNGDSNLVPENIASGVSIFGVEGTLEAESGNTNSNMINIDVTVYKGDYVYYLDGNKNVCSVTGTSILKGTVFNIDAHCGLIYTVGNDAPIWGVTGNYVCRTTDQTQDNEFVMFLENGGSASTRVLST